MLACVKAKGASVHACKVDVAACSVSEPGSFHPGGLMSKSSVKSRRTATTYYMTQTLLHGAVTAADHHEHYLSESTLVKINNGV